MKTQIYPPSSSSGKIPSTALIIGVVVAIGAIAFFLISKKSNDGTYKEE